MYIQLGISGIWCYDQGQLTVYLLQSGEYQPSLKGRMFPLLKVQGLLSLIEAHRNQGRLAVREWVRGQTT